MSALSRGSRPIVLQLSLVEVIASIVISALLLGVVGQSLYTAGKAVHSVQIVAANDLRLQTFERRLLTDVTSIYAYRFSRYRSFTGNRQEIRFFVLDGEKSDIKEVAYRIQREWVERWESSSPAKTEGEPSREPIWHKAIQLRSARWSYYDLAIGGWVDYWDSAVGAVPAAVRLQGQLHSDKYIDLVVPVRLGMQIVGEPVAATQNL